jgi:hypothetical protein
MMASRRPNGQAPSSAQSSLMRSLVQLMQSEQIPCFGKRSAECGWNWYDNYYLAVFSQKIFFGTLLNRFFV